MIPILFEYNATNFNSHGLGDLIDCISCEAICNADGEYELSLQYPVSSPMFSELTINRIVYAKANDYHPWQAFRIYGYEKEIRGVQTIKCQHISYDLHCMPTKELQKFLNITSCQMVLNAAKARSFVTCPFNFYTDITRLPHMEEHIFVSDAPTSIRALLLDGDDSVHGAYGGDLVFNNYDVFLMNMAGEDRGVTIDYGVDLVDLSQEENISEMVTGILPYFRYNVADENDESPTYGESSDFVTYGSIQYCPGTFQRQNIQAVDLTDQFPNQEQGTYPSTAELNSKAQEWIEANDVGHPIISLTVSYATLGQDVRLHDAVTVRFHEMGIDVKSKVTSYKYDVLAERPIEIEIGKTRASSMFSLEDASRLKKGLIPPKRIQKKSIGQDQIQNGGVGGNGISSAGVQSKHLQNKAVKEEKINDNAVTVNKIKDGAVVEEKIDTDAVTNSKIKNKAISRLKCDDEIDALFEDLIYVRDLFAEYIEGGTAHIHYMYLNFLQLNEYNITGRHPLFVDEDHEYAWNENEDGYVYNLGVYSYSTNKYVPCAESIDTGPW